MVDTKENTENDNKNENQNSDTTATKEKVYGNGPGDIKTPGSAKPHNFLKEKFYSTSLLGVLKADTGRFDYDMIEDPLEYKFSLTTKKTVQRSNEDAKKIKLYAEHKELENSADEAIYELLGISYEKKTSKAQQEREEGKIPLQPLTPLEEVNDIVPNETLDEYKKQQFYNMKYYIFSNMLNEKAFLGPGECKTFQNNLTTSLGALKTGTGNAFNHLKETSDVTKLTYILGATMGEKSINNTNYIKDRLAEQTLKNELGGLVTNTLDDYKHWSEADIDWGKSVTPLLTAAAVLIISVVVGSMVGMIGTTITGTVGLPIALYAAIAVTGAGVSWAIGYFGSQRDQYTSIYKDVNVEMMKNINNIPGLSTKEAIELLGKVEVLRAEVHQGGGDIEHMEKLNNYRTMLLQHSGVQELQGSNLNNIFSTQIKAINQNLNKNWDVWYRMRKTAKQKDPDAVKLDNVPASEIPSESEVGLDASFISSDGGLKRDDDNATAIEIPSEYEAGLEASFISSDGGLKRDDDNATARKITSEYDELRSFGENDAPGKKKLEDDLIDFSDEKDGLEKKSIKNVVNKSNNDANNINKIN